MDNKNKKLCCEVIDFEVENKSIETLKRQAKIAISSLKLSFSSNMALMFSDYFLEKVLKIKNDKVWKESGLEDYWIECDNEKTPKNVIAYNLAERINKNLINEIISNSETYSPEDEITFTKLRLKICDKCLKKVFENNFEEAKRSQDRLLHEQDFFERYYSKNRKTETNTNPLLTIKKIKEKTKKVVIGQDDLVDKLSIILYFHYLKSKGLIKNKKSVIPLITGLTGSGKTLTAKTISEIINVPFLIIPITSFTGTGWSGTNIEEYFFKLKEKHKEDAKNAIILIDEFDKVLSSSIKNNQKDFEDLKQYRLLTLIEGEDIVFEGCEKGDTLSTENMQFILCGSFQSFIDEKTSIGFSDNHSNDSYIKGNKHLNKAELIKMGIKPELASRISQIIKTNAMTLEDYFNVLK